MTDKKLLTHIVSELVHPAATELGQLLADQIRFARGKMLIRIIERAKAYSRDHDLRSKDVPFKFLLQFIESASLEDDQDDDLVDLWAKLLANAHEEYSSFHLTCLNILKVLTTSEAKLLHAMWRCTSANEVWNAWNQKFPNLISEAWMNHPYELPDQLPGHVFHKFHEDDVPNIEELNLQGFDTYIDLIHMQSLGLVDMICGSKYLNSKRQFYIIAKISPLGFQFVESCESE